MPKPGSISPISSLSIRYGYSRFVATGEDVRKRFFSVDGDVNAVAVVIPVGSKSTIACCRQNMSRAKATVVFAGQSWCARCRSSKVSA